MSKKRILIADDDYDLREQISYYLRNKGFETIKADSKEEAAKIIGKESFDAALLDLMMENQDSGFVLCHKIKSNYPNIPVPSYQGQLKKQV